MRGSSFHLGSIGSLLVVPTMTPTEFSSPAGFKVPATELDGKLMISTGFQPDSAALRIACAANLGVPATNSASAPELFRLTTCESMVGSVTSYAAVTTRLSKSAPRNDLKAL